jgi:methionyl-tRNA synthetase
MAAPPAGAQTSQADLKKMSSSTVAADHRALAARYRAHAAEHEADAALHNALVADLNAGTADDETWDLARDAAHYAQHSREAAEALRDLAALHEAVADRLGPVAGEKTPSAGGCCEKKMADKADKKAPKSAEPDHSAH